MNSLPTERQFRYAEVILPNGKTASVRYIVKRIAKSATVNKLNVHWCFVDPRFERVKLTDKQIMAINTAILDEDRNRSEPA